MAATCLLVAVIVGATSMFFMRGLNDRNHELVDHQLRWIEIAGKIQAEFERYRAVELRGLLADRASADRSSREELSGIALNLELLFDEYNAEDDEAGEPEELDAIVAAWASYRRLSAAARRSPRAFEPLCSDREAELSAKVEGGIADLFAWPRLRRGRASGWCAP